jgi:predicted TIM-barrel fold metal-dependent hydrolase
MDKLLIISADDHAGARAADYVPYFEPKYREAARGQIAEEAEFMEISRPFATFSPEALDLIDERNAIRSGGEEGGWDLGRRLKELDAEGCAAEIVHAGHQRQMCPFFTPISRAYPGELRSAGARAHHRWFVDAMGSARDRIFGVADPGACLDMNAAVEELNWCADHGFIAIGCPGVIWDEGLPPLYDSYYEPFWKACTERTLVLSVHTGWGAQQGRFFAFQERIMADPSLADMLARGEIQEFIQKTRALQGAPKVDIAPRAAFWQLILGGVFDRYPELKITFSELRSDWLPATLSYLDERFSKERGRAKLKPSEYFQKQAYIVPSAPRLSELAQRNDIGIGRMMFGIDYPHPEGTWPNSLDWLRGVLADCTEYEARRFCGENALECYELNGPALRKIAARIGPDLSNIVGGKKKLSSNVTAQFDARAGYSQPAESVDRSLLLRHLDADLAAAPPAQALRARA